MPSLYLLAISPEARMGPGEGHKAYAAGEIDTDRNKKERAQPAGTPGQMRYNERFASEGKPKAGGSKKKHVKKLMQSYR